jgi:hypothetical protein
VVRKRLQGALASSEVKVTDGRERGTRPRRPLSGKCYQEALDYLHLHAADWPGARLVHGRAGGVAHAWVEFPDGVVFDGVFQRFYRQRPYYAVLAAVVQEVYDAKEATRLMLATGTWGPWTVGERVAAVPGAKPQPQPAAGGAAPAKGQRKKGA